jgi:uncharacterized protein (DUF1501 family)
MKRRNFLQTTGLISAAAMLPGFLNKAAGSSLLNTGPFQGKKLIIIQLSGGNDGLNTVIPVRNDLYYKLRPTIGLKGKQTLQLDSETGLHASLPILKELYDQGELAILQEVGYPNPVRSHFRSMDIWHTGSDSDRYLNTGWLGRYLDSMCAQQTCHGERGIELDDSLSLALRGEKSFGLAMRSPDLFYAMASNPIPFDLSNRTQLNQLDFLYKVLADSRSSAAELYKQYSGFKSKQQYPNSALGRSLMNIAGLIGSGIEARVYYTSLTGFDSHGNQLVMQARRFGEFQEAFEPFIKDLKSIGQFDSSLIMVFSEFGRRVAQNANNGTDHGAGNCLFIAGGSLKKRGLLNGQPNLEKLHEGDLKHQIDFRSVYATLLNKWLQADDRLILGKSFPLLDFI